MPLNPMGVLDLSIVTELLIDQITAYWPASPLWPTLFSDAYFFPNITGLTPESVRNLEGCQLTLSLIHIEPSKAQRNFVWPPTPPSAHPRAQKIPQLPLGLDLYYFVSAYSGQNYQQEQQAISLVVNCFHQNPVISTNVSFPGSPGESTTEKFSLTMEIESVDSISRFWQATTAPFRLSVMYRAAVVFLTPPEPLATAKQVTQFALTAAPASFPFATSGQVFGTSSSMSFESPNSTPASPEIVPVNYAPATVTPAQRFDLYGAGLNSSTSSRVYLLSPPGYTTEQEVTATWALTDPGIQTASRIALALPATLLAGVPPPGVYLLRAGSQTPADAVTNRTNSTPFSVAAQVDVPGSPAGPVLIPDVFGYAFRGMGFMAGSTELLLDTVPLEYVALPPLASGQFTVTGNTDISFQPPSTLASGLYTVRVRVNGVESPPALWIRI